MGCLVCQSFKNQHKSPIEATLSFTVQFKKLHLTYWSICELSVAFMNVHKELYLKFRFLNNNLVNDEQN